MAESPPSFRPAGDAPATPQAADRRFALGAAALDAVLGGGLQRGRLHELHAGAEGDLPSMTGFALMLALKAGGRSGTIVWLAQATGRQGGGGRQPGPPLYGPGLVELGADPARLLLVTVPDETTLLKAAADVVRSPAAGTAVIAAPPSPKRIDLTVTRRLTLFAERSGVTVLLLRGLAAEMPSAAATRWRIAAAPSALLEADAPGGPAFQADLVRRRGGPPSVGWRLEWDRDALAFAASLPGAVAADGGGRRVEPG